MASRDDVATPEQADARWLLATLFLVALILSLLFQGFARHQVGKASTAGSSDGAATAGSGAVPASVVEGGPVLDLTGAAPRSLRVPARTLVRTFDDGPDPHWTDRVLDVLARHRAHATFFVIGARALDHPALLRRELAGDNEIGIHTFTHADLGALPLWRDDLELSLAQKSVAAATPRRCGCTRASSAVTVCRESQRVPTPTTSMTSASSGRGVSVHHAHLARCVLMSCGGD